jgi:hypothetical protein
MEDWGIVFGLIVIVILIVMYTRTSHYEESPPVTAGTPGTSAALPSEGAPTADVLPPVPPSPAPKVVPPSPVIPPAPTPQGDMTNVPESLTFTSLRMESNLMNDEATPAPEITLPTAQEDAEVSSRSKYSEWSP